MDAQYCRYNIIYDIGSILEKETKELKDTLDLCEVDTIADTEHITLALQFVKQREDEWKTWAKANIPNGPPKRQKPPQKQQQSINRSQSEDPFEEEIEDSEEEEKISTSKLSSIPLTPFGTVDRRALEEFYYYYQSVDEQMLFLDGMNFRMLLTDRANNFEALPSRIKGKIIDFNRMQLDSYLKNKNVYLSHFPTGSDFCFVECDIKKYVSEQTYKQFEKDILFREHKRTQKQKQQEKENIEMEKKDEEERQNRFKELERRKFNLIEEEFPAIDPSKDVEQNPEIEFPALPKSTAPIGMTRKNASWSQHVSKSLEKSDEEEFPSLASTIDKKQKNGSSSGSGSSKSKKEKNGEKSKGRKKGIVILSTNMPNV